MISRQIDLTINKMTKAQYNGISPVADEVYVITDEAGCVTSVNGIQPDSSGNVIISIPSAVTEATVAGWGFTKNVGTVTSVNGVSPTNGNVAITIPTVNDGTLTITQDGNTLGTFTANQSGNTTVNIPSGSSSRNIGEIVASTIPLTDAGLHLLDGALISGSGSYSAFVDYIAGLVTDYPDLFDTEANWQSAVTQYGVCGKFVYTQPTYQLIDTASSTTGWFTHSLEVGSQIYATNGTPQITIASISGNHITVTGAQAALFPNGFDRDTANDVGASIRLPKITGIVEGTTDLTALGDLVEAGLPNITGAFGLCVETSYMGGSGAFAKIDEQTESCSLTGNKRRSKWTFDASRSNAIYGNSTTVQPQAIKVLYYIVVATSTKTQIQVDIDEIATDLNGKMDTDGTNAVSSVKFADGQWIGSNINIIGSALTMSAQTTYTFNLNTLPNDGYIYEVLITAYGKTASTSGSMAGINIGSSIVDVGYNRMASAITRTSGYSIWSTGGTIPIGTDRNIYIRQALNYSSIECSIFKVMAYRRIGTNQ